MSPPCQDDQTTLNWPVCPPPAPPFPLPPYPLRRRRLVAHGGLLLRGVVLCPHETGQRRVEQRVTGVVGGRGRVGSVRGGHGERLSACTYQAEKTYRRVGDVSGCWKAMAAAVSNGPQRQVPLLS